MFRFTLVLLAALTSGSVMAADLGQGPELRDIKLKMAYIPFGFDDNDRVQMTVGTTLPNTCYRIGPHQVQVDAARKTITVKQQAYVYKFICLQMLSPVTQSLDVGLLAPGNWTLLDGANKSVLGTLPVLRSTNSGPDDVLYAPVQDAYVTDGNNQGPSHLILKGSYADRCSEITDVQVKLQKDVIVVQPIMKHDEGRCEAEDTPFLKDVELPSSLHGAYLLHVRSLNGQAINRMVQIP